MNQSLPVFTGKKIGPRSIVSQRLPDYMGADSNGSTFVSSDSSPANQYPAHWKRPPVFIKNGLLRWALLLLAIIWFYLAVSTIEVNWVRVAEGMERGWRFIKGFLTPDFTSRWSDISAGLVESLTMTLTSTVAGVLLSVPIGIGAAQNVAPKAVYYVCRSIIAVSRSLQEIIIAILFVTMFGFGPFAGFLTLSFATIGFLAKLLAEDIEDIDEGQTEAIRSTGASWLQLINYAVQPQVMPRLIGLSLYRLDINFRESAVIGIVGAGGIGATLNTAIDRYEFDSAGAILLIIIAIVMLAEYSSGFVRRWVQ
ncbi:MAG: phosphonate ABC transporter, permease protein PhnE [Granulosicoccus sp.]